MYVDKAFVCGAEQATESEWDYEGETSDDKEWYGV